MQSIFFKTTGRNSHNFFEGMAKGINIFKPYRKGNFRNVKIATKEHSGGGHMGIENINRLIGSLAEISAVDEKTEKYLTHFSHKFEPLQQVLETKAARFDLKVAFDGAKIEI